MSSIVEDGKHVVYYDDGDYETLELSNERWRLSKSVHRNQTTFPKLNSIVPDVLRDM